MPVLEKAKAVYKIWTGLHRNIERTARFGIGNKVDQLFLELLELLRKAGYTPINKKIILLESVSEHIDSLRFFIQLLWELRLISNPQYISLAADMEDLGKMVGGWKKGLLQKQIKPDAQQYMRPERK